jgi:hypothetical protein
MPNAAANQAYAFTKAHHGKTGKEKQHEYQAFA